jgi:transcriptional regulator with XRE-family HTH domain
LTVPPPEPGTESRAALAARLRDLRATAGLSGNALAQRMGVVQSRVWKIENGKLLPAEQDIAAWVQATGAGGEVTGELLGMLAGARTEQAFGAVLRGRGGPAAYQERVRETEERSTRIGEFQVGVIPGLLQTAEYTRELVNLPAGLRTWGAGAGQIEDMIGARLRRQEILTSSGRQIQFVISEAALRILVVAPETLAGQLDKLLAVIRLPAVELGVIGIGKRVPAYTIGGFRVYDDALIVTESIAGEREFTRKADPDAVAAFLEAFSELRLAASTGDEAEALIQRALDDLRRHAV